MSSLQLDHHPSISFNPFGLNHPSSHQHTIMFNSLNLGRSRNPPTVTTKPPPSEALTAHPLLGSTSTTSNSNTTTESAGVTEDANKTPTLNYKPRQRHVSQNSYGSSGGGGGGSGGGGGASGPGTFNTASQTPTIPTLNFIPAPSTTTAQSQPSTSTSTSTTLPHTTTSSSSSIFNSSPSPSSARTSVTARLQLQSLKAAAQRMGLGNGSVGIQMLEGVFEKGMIPRHSVGNASASGSASTGMGGGEWGEVVRVLTSGKVSHLHLHLLAIPLSCTKSRGRYIRSSSSSCLGVVWIGNPPTPLITSFFPPRD